MGNRGPLLQRADHRQWSVGIRVGRRIRVFADFRGRATELFQRMARDGSVGTVGAAAHGQKGLGGQLTRWIDGSEPSGRARIAARSSRRGRVGRSTAFVFAGSSTAIVLGLPLMTALGQQIGWRAVFGLLAVVGALSVVALHRLLPPLPATPAEQRTSRRRRIRAAIAVTRRSGVALVCVLTAILLTAYFPTYTFLAPLLRQYADIEDFTLSLLLFGYGAIGLGTNLLAGYLVDQRPRAALVCATLTIAVALIAVRFVHSTPLTVLAVLALGAGLQLSRCRCSRPSCGSPPTVVTLRRRFSWSRFRSVSGAGRWGERLVSAGQLAQLPLLGGAVAVIVAGVIARSSKTFPKVIEDDPT